MTLSVCLLPATLLLLLLQAHTTVAATRHSTNITVEITCTESSVKATWSKSDFNGGNVTKVEWNDQQCNGFDENQSEFYTTTNFSECRSVVTQENEKIVQTNTARVHVNYGEGIVQRESVYSFALRCEMDRNLLTPVGVGYNVTSKRIFTDVNTTSETDFNVRMDIYTDATFNEVAVNPIFASFDPIFIGIKEVYNNELLKFVTQECFATPTSDINDVKYKFYDGKCPVDDTFRNINITTQYHRFQIQAFKFSNFADAVYLHCKLSVCKVNSTADSCAQATNCNNDRKRRDVSPLSRYRRDVESDVEEIVVMSQRCTFAPEMKFNIQTCRTTLCRPFSSCIEFNPPECRCVDDYVRHPHTDTCTKERTFTITGLSFDMEFIPAYADTTSVEFVRLSKRIEKQLLHMVRQVAPNSNNILGVKVIRARAGSVIVDVRVMYGQGATKDQAYATFRQAVTGGPPDPTFEDPLPIKPNNPINIEEDSIPTTQRPLRYDVIAPTSLSIVTLAVAVAVPTVVISVAVMCLIYCIKVRRRNVSSKIVVIKNENSQL